MILVHHCTDWRAKLQWNHFKMTFLVSLFTTRVGKQHVFNRPNCCSCRLCTVLILDPATHLIRYWLFSTVLLKRSKRGVPKDILDASPSKNTWCMCYLPYKSEWLGQLLRLRCCTIWLSQKRDLCRLWGCVHFRISTLYYETHNTGTSCWNYTQCLFLSCLKNSALAMKGWRFSTGLVKV